MTTTACGGDPLESPRRVLLLGSVAALAAGAWLAIGLWGGSANGLLLHAHGPAPHGIASAHALLLLIVGWTAMTVAMMLPTSLPVIGLFHAIAGQRSDRALLVALVISGYMVIWVAFGVAVYLGQVALGGLIPKPADSLWRGGAPILFLAGVYQFTPLKYRCLEKCRSPLSFVVGHWQGRRDRWQAFRLGVDHGLFCVGCCWTLMLLMFVTGLGNIGWMFVLAAIMAVEKNVSWGRRVSAPLGGGLLMCALILALAS